MISRLVVLALVAALCVHVVAVEAQPSIMISVYADSACKILVSGNQSLPAFDLSGRCTSLGTQGWITQCNTQGLKFQIWQNNNNCPAQPPPYMSLISAGPPGKCSAITVSGPNGTQSAYAVFTCNPGASAADTDVSSISSPDQLFSEAESVLTSLFDSFQQRPPSRTFNPDQLSSLPLNFNNSPFPTDPNAPNPLANLFNNPNGDRPANPFDALANFVNAMRGLGANPQKPQPGQP